MRPRASTCCPAFGVKPSAEFLSRNIAHRTWASRSLSEKYQCPDEGCEKFDNSPSTHTTPSPRSRSTRTSRLRRETVKTLRPVSAPAWTLEDMRTTIAQFVPSGMRFTGARLHRTIARLIHTAPAYTWFTL